MADPSNPYLVNIKDEGTLLGSFRNLNFVGAGVTVTGASPSQCTVTIPGSSGGTKTRLFPANYSANFGDYRVDPIAGSGNGRFTFEFPTDFASITSLALVAICSAGVATTGRNIDLSSDYGSLGELYNQQSESNTTSTYDFTGMTDRFVSISLLSVFTTAAAGDFAGVFVEHFAIGGTLNYVGVRLVYS